MQFVDSHYIISMLENSQDILNIAKTLGVLILSFTLAALFYYLAKTAKEVFQIVKEMQTRIHKLDELIQLQQETVHFLHYKFPYLDFHSRF